MNDCIRGLAAAAMRRKGAGETNELVYVVASLETGIFELCHLPKKRTERQLSHDMTE